jgi:hypothetical protein
MKQSKPSHFTMSIPFRHQHQRRRANGRRVIVLRPAGGRSLQPHALVSRTVQGAAGLLCSLLVGMALAGLLLMPGAVYAAPPAITPTVETVTVHPTTKAVVYPAARQLVQTFTDATLASTAPVAAGQIGWSTDGHLLYRGTGTSAGNWVELVPDATESTEGKVELATQAEVTTGTDTTRVVTPATLEGKLDGILEDADSGFKISSNGAGGFKLELWNADQSIYQEVRLAGASGAERLVIVAAP